MSPAPSKPSAPKRPWYLVAALVAGWVLGANAMNDGCNAIAFYKGEHVDVEAAAHDITDAAARTNVIALGERYVAALDAARSRALPIGIAALLFGAAMVMFSARAMSGRPGARGQLVQVTLARAALAAGSFFITPDVQRAQREWELAGAIAIQREHAPDPKTMERAEGVAKIVARAWPAVQLLFGTVTSAFVVVALTRPRTREFFEAASRSLSER